MTPYITTSQADEYIAALIPSTGLERTAWESLDDADKAIFVGRSMRKIEALPFSGAVAVSSQDTAFPRRGQTEVPEAVKQAVALEAAALAAYGDEAEQRDRIKSQGISSFRLGNLSESYNRGASSYLLSSVAYGLLRPFMAGGVACV